MSVERLERARARMDDLGVDVLLASVGADLPYLTGYEAMPLERLTMLVLPREGDAQLFVPRLEAPRVPDPAGAFEVVAWEETEDPVELVAARVGSAGVGGPGVVAIGDHTWARFVLALQRELDVEWRSASDVLAPLRAVKDAAEVAALKEAAEAVDVVAVAMRDQGFSGRSELDVHRELVERMLDAGHDRTNFAIVASRPNGASPHHDPTSRVIQAGDVVLCDFGGSRNGYCSDITRMYVVGEPDADVARAYDVLAAAQEAGVRAAEVGTPCEAVDAAAREVIAEAGYGEYFVHRTGHGIGVEAHEDPYLVAGNAEALVEGNAFSIEPGIYLEGRFGLRLEDIVVATESGPQRLNRAPRDLAVVT